MTVNEYISQKFQSFGINLSEADLFDIVEGAGLENGDIERDKSNKARISVAIAKFIPLYCFVPLQSVKAASRCLGTFKVSRTTIHSCASSTD